jgi:hypothetical protein
MLTWDLARSDAMCVRVYVGAVVNPNNPNQRVPVCAHVFHMCVYARVRVLVNESFNVCIYQIQIPYACICVYAFHPTTATPLSRHTTPSPHPRLTSPLGSRDVFRWIALPRAQLCRDSTVTLATLCWVKESFLFMREEETVTVFLHDLAARLAPPVAFTDPIPWLRRCCARRCTSVASAWPSSGCPTTSPLRPRRRRLPNRAGSRPRTR